MVDSVNLVFAFLVSFLFSHSAGAETFYRVTRIVDGDTIIVANGLKVRLIGVDTPESKHPKKPVQYFAKEASAFLETFALGKKVRLSGDNATLEKDRFGRVLAYVHLESGELINSEIIKQGFGFAYVKYAFLRMEEFRAHEKSARERKLGLWAKQTHDFDALPVVKVAPTDHEVVGHIFKTKTGTKYHRLNCTHLKNGSVEIDLNGAKALGLKPCSVCKP